MSTLPFIISLSVSDCFVAPFLKLTGGKQGHGERRLYTGNSRELNDRVASKPWKLHFTQEYQDEVRAFFDDPSSCDMFAKTCDDRKEKMLQAIQTCHHQYLDIVPQNGDKDVVRYYIGPNKQTMENVKKYDTFRCTMIPKLCSIELTDTVEYMSCTVVMNAPPTSRKRLRQSVSCLEYFQYLSKTEDIEIQHAENKGEFQLRNPTNGYFWPVDGYHDCTLHRCRGTSQHPCPYHRHIWEFHGDYYHGNPHRYSLTDSFHASMTYQEKHEKDNKKKEFYESQGYQVCVVWESEWIQQKKDMKQRHISWN